MVLSVLALAGCHPSATVLTDLLSDVPAPADAPTGVAPADCCPPTTDPYFEIPDPPVFEMTPEERAARLDNPKPTDAPHP